MSRLVARSPAAPFQTSRPAPVTPGQQQRKNSQDEARRQQQSDEKIRELEEENERLESALRDAMILAITFSGDMSDHASDVLTERLQDALSGGGEKS